MKKFLVLLMALLPGHTKAQGAKLGSEADPIRHMLFASQSLKEQVSQMQLDGKPGPMQTIADASKLVDDGKREEAIARLRGALKTPELETRVQLWIWSALRELGEKPDEKFAYEVIGVVLEMPSGGAYDSLAAYGDGTARYLNFSGKGIFWDVPDATIKRLCGALIASTIPAGSQAKPRTSLSLPEKGSRVTLLTRSGIFAISDPSGPIVGEGAALMIELIKRTEEKNN